MPSELTINYGTVLQNLKEKIRQPRLQATYSVNIQLLVLYWTIGDTILQQQAKEGWGTKVMDRLDKESAAAFCTITKH